MAYLSFISDDHLFRCIDALYNSYARCQHEFTVDDFYSNKVDPIKFIFDMAFNGIDEESYIKAEITRQNDKTISNAIGDFHQSLLGGIAGLRDLGVGNGCDIVNADQTIFAEVKNKHNTMNSSSAEATIQKLIHFAEQYPQSTCYWVQIIAMRSINKLWSASYNGRLYSHPRVRKISGDQFYALVTGIPDAFKQLCDALPIATQEYLRRRAVRDHDRAENASVFQSINRTAQRHNRSLLEQIMAENFDTYTGF